MLLRNRIPVQVVARFSAREVCRRIAGKNPASKDAGYKKPRELRRAWCGAVMTILAATFIPAHLMGQKTPPQKPVGPPAGVEIVSNAGEPELRVDGVPFFIHAAQFDYFRIPLDLWFRSLDRYRELGINTIDLRIPWNWHEIRDAEFDLDGNAAARVWLANETHMTYARRWLTAIARELAPYGSKKTVRITEPGEREGETQEKEISGPLLF